MYLPLDLVDGTLVVLNVRGKRRRNVAWVLEDGHPVGDHGHEGEHRECSGVGEPSRRGQAQPPVNHHEHSGVVDVHHSRENEQDRQRHVAPHPPPFPLGFVPPSPSPSTVCLMSGVDG